MVCVRAATVVPVALVVVLADEPVLPLFGGSVVPVPEPDDPDDPDEPDDPPPPELPDEPEPDDSEDAVDPFVGPPDSTELPVWLATDVDPPSSSSALVDLVTSTSSGVRESPGLADEPTVTRRLSDE